MSKQADNKQDAKQEIKQEVEIKKEVEVENEAKPEVKVENSLNQEKMNLGEVIDETFDPYKIPEEFKKVYPEMHFHFFDCSQRGMSKMRMKRYKVFHIPDDPSCKYLLDEAKLEPKPNIVKSYGDDVWVVGENILGMCPREIYAKKKASLRNQRLQREKELALKAKMLQRTVTGVKSANISTSPK